MWPATLTLWLSVAAAAAASAAAGAARPPELSVPRCCRAGERLDPSTLQGISPPPPGDVRAACRPDPAAVWAPLVYAPVRGKLLDRVPAHWRVKEDAPPLCASLRVLHHHTAPYALLANNASLMLGGLGRMVPPERYCADVQAALVCAEDVPRVPSKCCAAEREWDGAHCVPGAEGAARAVSELRQLSGGGEPAGGWPGCAGGAGERYVEAGVLAGATLREDGALAVGGGGVVLAAGAWCAEWVRGSEVRVLACEAAAGRAGGGAGGGGGGRYSVYGAALAVGALFLAATLAASLLLPAAHHALHWRCQTHYVAALMLGDALLAGTQLAGSSVPPVLCRGIAVCMHFLFLSAFFWLNTMCFNIWWTFRDFRPTSLERGQEAWRLRVYSLYAWGAPLLLAGTGAALDAAAAAGAPAAASLLRPRFAEQRCWFYGDTEILVYFFGPVGVLLLVNLALFASTTRQLTCGLWRRDEVKSTSERAALGRVCAKLVVVMGVTWGADVASWALGGPEYVWYATDLLNALQGVFIFLVVGCQRHSLSGAAACWRRVRGGRRRWGGRGGRGGAAGGDDDEDDGGGGGRGGGRGGHTHSSTQLPSCGESLTNTTAAPLPAAAPPPVPASAPAKLPMETVC